MADRRRVGRRVLLSSSSSSSISEGGWFPDYSSNSPPNLSDSPSSPDFSPPSRQSSEPPNDSRFPLSLQDMCMLNILLRVEDFPIQSLAHLPRGIRKRLLLGLSHADILHVDKALLFGGLNVEFDYSRGELDQRGPTIAREELLDVILRGVDLSKFFSLNLYSTEVLDCFEPLHEWLPQRFLYKHIQKCYPSLGSQYSSGSFLLKRFQQFVGTSQFKSSSRHDCDLPLLSHLAWPLLHHCNMHRAPKELKIDCYDFQKTAFWIDYQETLNEKRTLFRQQKDHPMSKMDPVIPFMQEFLSSVEVLELGTDNSPRDVDGLDEALHTVPYVLLYNVLTSSQPCLKHLKVYGIPVHTSWVLETIAELVCTTDRESCFHSYTFVPLASPKPEPCQIESLSILPFEIDHGYACDYMRNSVAHTIASITKSIISFQMQTLSSVTVQGLGFCYSDDAFDVRDSYEDRIDSWKSGRDVNSPAYIALLTLFNELLKQPHFQALSVGQSPHLVACTLIETFLTTPASHEQLLSIEGNDKLEMNQSNSDEDTNRDEITETESEEEECEGNKSRKRRGKIKTSEIPPKKIAKPSLNPPLPETNAQYKCLDLGLSSSCVYSWLFTLPELKLKKLRMRTQDITIVLADMVIQVEHVAFTTETHFYTSYKPTISPAHLEKFVVSNSALKRLEFTEPTDKCAPGLIPALNHCLSIFYEQGRGLEELVLNSVKFYDRDHMKEFFIRVRDLSHRYGTTLVLSNSFDVLFCNSSVEEESSFFAEFSKEEFQEKKIKKIIYTIQHYDFDNMYTASELNLGLLAAEMALHHPVRLRTSRGRII